MKHSVARRLIGERRHFWQARYYDFNVWSEKKRVEKLRYRHRNPVTRGLVERPEDWAWSSFRHYLTGEEGVVEIESQWTARRRENMGMPLRVRPTEIPTPSKTGSGGAPRRVKMRVVGWASPPAGSQRYKAKAPAVWLEKDRATYCGSGPCSGGIGG